MHKTTIVIGNYAPTKRIQIRYDTLHSIELTGDFFGGGAQRTGVNTDSRLASLSL